MFEPEQTILLSSNLLRSPWLFDSLGASGDLCRDLVIYASISKTPDVELYVPGFCRAMGYERSNLLRPCTPVQVEQIRQTGWDENLIPQVSNLLGLALVRLATKLFIFPSKKVSSDHSRVEGSRIVQSIDVPSYIVKKGVATTVKFVLSQEILEDNRNYYQTIYPAEYLSLRTAGGGERVGQPDNAARRLYLRLIWKRQYWDYRIAQGLATKEDSLDSYYELVEAGGLRRRNALGKQYDSEKKIVYELKQLLKRVGAMNSIGLVPTVLRNTRTGKYEVSWARLPIVKPRPVLASQLINADDSAPAAPAPSVTPSTRRTLTTKDARKSKKVTVQPQPQSQPQVYRQPTSREREKLLNDLEDKRNSLEWLHSPATVKQYCNQQELHGQLVEQAQVAFNAIADRLKEIGSKLL